MRQWLVNPRWMCRQHLLGEHVEIHMFLGSLYKGVNVSGYLNDGLLSPATLRPRHEELVQEMVRRGYNHKSPLGERHPIEEDKDPRWLIDPEDSKAELLRRCSECRQRHSRYELDPEAV